MHNAADDPPVVLPYRPGMHQWQVRRDRRPLPIVQPKIIRHDPSPPKELESHSII
jgi:hypothetical protein